MVDFDSFGTFESSNEGSLKLPICLLLDNSGSMQESTIGTRTRIDELNQNVMQFIEYIKNDSRARRIADLCIITFGGDGPIVVQGYSPIDKVEFRPLQARGRTPMGAGVEMAISLLERRRSFYRGEGVQHYKPIMLLMSDGIPTDQYKQAAIKATELVNTKQMKIFPVGIGQDFNYQVLSAFSPELPPKQLIDAKGLMTLFQLLSRSTSNPTDDSIDKWFKETI